MNQNYVNYAEVPMLLENVSSGQRLEIDMIKFEPASSGMMGNVTFYVNQQEKAYECQLVKRMFKHEEILKSYNEVGYPKKNLTEDFILYEYIKGESNKALELLNGIMIEANWDEGFVTVSFDYFKINPTARISRYFNVISSIDNNFPIPRHTIHCQCQQCQQHEFEGLNVIRETNQYR